MRWMPPETFGIHAAISADAQSAAIIARLDMDLKRLRWIAIVLPVAIVVLLEIVRSLPIGDLQGQVGARPPRPRRGGHIRVLRNHHRPHDRVDERPSQAAERRAARTSWSERGHLI